MAFLGPDWERIGAATLDEGSHSGNGVRANASIFERARIFATFLKIIT